uniref:NADH dehydrogenase subunit 4 n=1 Tax=Eudiplozoon nipponicum TaxID=116851 RepID=UPI001F146986|nr:NADH dehydrogenase subunit 4 [Eudiplozoon nipponicum]UKQ56155.1 NADH dehydrogenase subunit 4 [Eudiplozoon nipponicum]
MMFNKDLWCFYYLVLGLLFCIIGFSSLSVGTGIYFLGFKFDYLYFYLSFLVLLIFVFVVVFGSFTSSLNLFFLGLSCVSCLLSFCSCHSIWFWGFYELSIVFILFLIYLDSPYSDRFVAGWYLLLYSVFCGVPLLVLLFYFSFISGTYNYFFWSLDEDFSILIFLVLLIFCTEIPLPPFHSWLPVVHAEASTLVSICLSGYIMKLGVVGLLRFCLVIVGDYYFFYYLSFCLIFSCLMFLWGSEEIDYKRWLAVLSVSHIIICVLCLFPFSVFSGVFNCLLFSVGHGFAAGYFFFVIYYLEVLGGGRLVVNTSLVVGWSWSMIWFIVVGFFLVGSVPPFVNFFIELWLLGLFILNNNVWFILCFLFYLLFSSLVPLYNLGLGYTRRMGFFIGGSLYSFGMGFIIFFVILFLLLI